MRSTIRILHLEDDPSDAELIQIALKDAGIPCEFHRAETRAGFVSHLESSHFDVILSDNKLPDIDGIEALELVRSRGDTTPFIFVSGWMNDESRRRQLKSLGATECVSKSNISEVTAWLNGMYVARERCEYRDDAAALERLVTAVQQLSLARDLATVQAIVRSATRELSGADGATFVLRKGDCCYYADEDAISPLWKGQSFPMSTCLSGWAMLNRQPVVIEDIYLDPRIPQDVYKLTFVRSLVMVPIRTDDPLGAIGSYWAKCHVPEPSTVRILQALANTTAVALDNIRIYTELESLVATRTAELEATNRELESFAHSVSHDLRAPLRHIGGFAEIMSADTGNVLSEKSRNCLARINHATKRMNQLIDDLLQLSRTTQLPVNRQRIDFSALCIDVARQLRQAEPERVVVFNIEAGMEADGDPRLLRIAMENLLSNALKFSSGNPDATIDVGCLSTDDVRSYFVSDNGVGFDMKYAGKLFGAFQRMHSDHEFPGTGLGLATTQRIVHKHSGRIWAVAEPGKGARFSFTLGPEVAVTHRSTFL